MVPPHRFLRLRTQVTTTPTSTPAHHFRLRTIVSICAPQPHVMNAVVIATPSKRKQPHCQREHIKHSC